MGKKIIILLLLIIASITGCAKTANYQDDGHVRLGDYDIEFLGSSHRTEKDALDENVEVIYIDLRYTNNSDEANNFCYSVVDEAFQDGVQLKEFINYELADNSEELTDIQPGKSIDIKLAYELRDTSPVEIQLHELYNDSNNCTITLDLD